MSRVKRARLTNEERRETARLKQVPLPMDRQVERATANAKARLRRYQVPPLYRMSYKHSQPVQPLCYQRSI